MADSLTPVTMFPDPRNAPHDIVAIGGPPDSDLLIEAYRRGIFPWPIDDIPLPWFCPKRRAILDFDSLHVSSRLERFRRTVSWSYSIDLAFESVIEQCSRVPRPGQEGTWITSEIIDSYVELHRRGHAHSVEVWDGERLIGGLYGVDPGGAFGGESMFFVESNASKLALLHLIDHLRTRGLDWIDLQVMTPHMKSLGGRTIRRGEFLDRLETTLARRLRLFG